MKKVKNFMKMLIRSLALIFNMVLMQLNIVHAEHVPESDIFFVPYGGVPSEEFIGMSDWAFLRQALLRKNRSMVPYNWIEKPSQKKHVLLVAHWLDEWADHLVGLKSTKKILVMYEPPAVLSQMYKESVYSCFDTIFTWKDDLVDGKKFIKYYYPSMRPMINNVPDFKKKKLVTMINSNLGAGHPDELYTERRRVIEFFERSPSIPFEFYGKGWEERQYKNYKGRVKEKLDILKQYKFCFCYENMKNIQGYISEKIFDCFAAGCVPIYWGASNIQEYIPENCYILRENFQSMDELILFLQSMKETEYKKYIEAIRKYLNSPQAQLFTKENFANTIIRQIECVE